MDKKTIILIATCLLIVASGDALCQPDTLWTKIYRAEIEGSTLLHDGGYAYTGYKWGGHPDSSVTGRLDSEGEIVWENNFEGNIFANEVIETPDSGIAILGQNREISMIKKFDRNGELLYYWGVILSETTLMNLTLSEPTRKGK